MYSKRAKARFNNPKQRIISHFLFCTNICSIHGIAHIVRKNVSPWERLIWLCLVISATAWFIVLALQAWDHYETRPTVISIERDHWKWNTSFPSATLCLDSIDEEKVEDLILKLNITEEAENFKDFLNLLALGTFGAYENFEKYLNSTLYGDVEKYVGWVLDTRHTLDIVEIGQTFGELQEFQTIFTELGLCFAYNSQVAIYSTPEYWAQNTLKTVKTPDTVMINPNIPSPALLLTNLMSGYKIFFHGPKEIPDVSSKFSTVPGATYTTFQLISESVWTPMEVKNLNVNQRNCKFLDESSLKYSPVYSYNLCRIECRIQLCLKLCNCTPYYYRRIANEPICSPSGMICLSKYKNRLIYLIDGKRSVCSCLPGCETDFVTITKSETTDWFLGTNIKWIVFEYPTVRYKRSLIFSFTNLLVQVGGVAGLFLGCSILSVVELIYFLTLRFYWGVCRNKVVT